MVAGRRDGLPKLSRKLAVVCSVSSVENRVTLSTGGRCLCTLLSSKRLFGRRFSLLKYGRLVRTGATVLLASNGVLVVRGRFRKRLLLR